MRDYLYSRPPLVEVIAEVHWQLHTLSFLPVGGFDPFYQKALTEIGKAFAQQNFAHIEKLIPDRAPIEMFGDKVTTRFASAPQTWPIFQFGPGVFTVNLTPPYAGWEDFRKHLTFGLGVLQAAYPSASENLRINKLELRYVDAFREDHGVGSGTSFLYEGLNFESPLPATIADSIAVDGINAVTTMFETQFPVKGLDGSLGVITIAPGISNDEKALLAQFICRKNLNGDSLNIEALLSWFDASQNHLQHWFELSLKDATRQSFGERTEI